MRGFRYATCLAVLSAAALVGSAAPPDLKLPPELKPVDGFVTYEPPADVFQIDYKSVDGLSRFPAALLGNKKALVIPTKGEKEGRYRFWVSATNDKGELTTGELTVVIGSAPKVDPIVPPGPVDPPLPVKVDSFYVLLVRDNGATYLPEQIGILDGIKVETALKATTKGDAAKFAYRRIDVKADPATLPAGLGTVWTKAKASIVANNNQLPLIVVAVNDVIHIDDLPATAEATAAHITKLRGN